MTELTGLRHPSGWRLAGILAAFLAYLVPAIVLAAEGEVWALLWIGFPLVGAVILWPDLVTTWAG